MLLDFNLLYLHCKNPICAELTERFGSHQMRARAKNQGKEKKTQRAETCGQSTSLYAEVSQI